MGERDAPFRRDGQRAVVTGANRGIGAAIAVALARAGAEIIAVPTNWVASFKRTVWDDRGYCQGDYVAMATAAQNGVVMACSDRIGVERGFIFIGASIIVAAAGWPRCCTCHLYRAVCRQQQSRARRDGRR